MDVSGKRLFIPCRPCEISESRRPAFGYCQDCREFLCNDCYKKHTKPASCRHHVLLETEHMPTGQSKPMASPNDTTDYCLQHVTQMLRYYCEDHKVCICFRCLTTTHKDCKCQDIAELAGSDDTSTEYQDILKKADYLRRLCDIDKQAVHDSIADINQAKEYIVDGIKKVREEINERINQMEVRLIKECDEVIEKENQRLSDLNEQLVGLVDEIGKIEKTLKDYHDDRRFNQLFVGIKTTGSRLNELFKRENDISEKNVIQAFEFAPNKDLIDEIEAMQARNELGKLIPELRTMHGDVLSKRLAIIEARDQVISKRNSVVFSHTGELSVTSPSENEDCHITGIVGLYPDEIAVVDRANNSVKRIDVRRNKVIAVQKLPNKPWDITLLPEGEIAVTIPDDKIVQVISLSNRTLSIRRSFKTLFSCYGLCYNQGKLYATSYSKTWMSTASIFVFDISGEVVNQFDCGDMFRKPDYIIASKTGKYLYVTDECRESVSKLSIQGEILIDCILQEPVDSGLQELNDGTVVNCCRGRGDIVRMSRTLRKLNIGLPDKFPVQEPNVMAYCDRSQRIFIGGTGNKIHVFNLRWDKTFRNTN